MGINTFRLQPIFVKKVELERRVAMYPEIHFGGLKQGVQGTVSYRTCDGPEVEKLA